MSKLKCINGFTKEKIIQVVKRQFKGKSFIEYKNGGVTCAYRGENNTKCAVGMFIPNNLYHIAMDRQASGTTIEHVVKLSPKLKQILPLRIDALVEFQTIHDSLDDSVLTNKEQKQVLIDWINKRVQ